MTKQIEQLDADRLIDPTRRKLLLGSAGAVGWPAFSAASGRSPPRRWPAAA